MSVSEAKDLPRRVTVKEVISGRYPAGERPYSWDQRYAAAETVVTVDDEELVLISNGGQSTPSSGWELLLTEEVMTEDGQKGIAWTLFGLTSS